MSKKYTNLQELLMYLFYDQEHDQKSIVCSRTLCVKLFHADRDKGMVTEHPFYLYTIPVTTRTLEHEVDIHRAYTAVVYNNKLIEGHGRCISDEEYDMYMTHDEGAIIIADADDFHFNEE